MGYWYRTGTVSVTNGSNQVTGTTTGWLSTVRAGDLIFIGNNPPVEVGSVDDNTTITLVENWPNTTVTDGAYAVAQGLLWNDVTRLANEVTNALASQVAILSGTGAPDDSVGADGDRYFQVDEANYYIKTGDTWGDPIAIMGPTGPAGPTYAATSTTSRSIASSGSMSFTVASGLPFQIGNRVRVAYVSGPTNYVEGLVSAYSGTTLTVSVDNSGGSGTFSNWTIGIAGDKGAKGDTGASYAATSTSSLTIGTGSQSLTTQAGLAYVIGQRIRVANDASNWMEGPITAYSGTSLTFTCDLVGGSGTFTSWTLGVAGARGATGSQGIQGSTGSQGPAGASYAGTSTSSNSIATGNKTFTTQAGLAYVVGSRARAADSSNPDVNFIEGVVTAYSSTSMTIAVDKAVGSGTITSWNISLAGQPGTNGTNGTNGSNFVATSTTSLTPATGDKVFTVAAGLSFVNGQRLRAASDADPTTNWLSGIVTAYSGTSLTITADLVGASPASASDWNISLSGEKGDSSSGDVVGPSSAVDQRVAIFDGTTGKLLADAGVSVADILAAAVAASSAPRNRVINPTLAIAQAGVGSTADGAYSGIDQFYVLTQTAAVTSSQLTNVADGVPSMGRLTQSQASAQRMGWAIPFESSFVKDLRGKTVALAAKVRMSAATTLRFAIVEWTGTADSITKDIVNSWTNTTFTAGNFFISTTTTIVATGSIALASSTLTDIALSGSISSSMNNLIIFFWTDSAQAQTTTLDLGNVWFGIGSSAPSTFEPPVPADDLARCLRYYAATPGSGVSFTLFSGNVTSGNTYRAQCRFPVPMRVAPSVSLTNDSGISFPASAGSVAATDIFGFQENRTANATAPATFRSSWVADARL